MWFYLGAEAGSSRLSYFAGKGGSLQASTIYVSCKVPLRIRCTIDLYTKMYVLFMQFKLNLLPPLTAAAMIHSAFQHYYCYWIII